MRIMTSVAHDGVVVGQGQTFSCFIDAAGVRRLAGWGLVKCAHMCSYFFGHLCSNMAGFEIVQVLSVAVDTKGDGVGAKLGIICSYALVGFYFRSVTEKAPLFERLVVFIDHYVGIKQAVVFGRQMTSAAKMQGFFFFVFPNKRRIFVGAKAGIVTGEAADFPIEGRPVFGFFDLLAGEGSPDGMKFGLGVFTVMAFQTDDIHVA